MNKKRKVEKNNACPICGGIIWGKGEKVLIEGAKITVCQSCAQYGKKITSQVKISPTKRAYINKPKTTLNKNFYKSKNFLETSMDIVPDYAKRIRETRTLKKLNQDQFAQKLNEKPSLIRRIEAGKVEPTIKLAKKIEKVYNIKLLKKPDEIEIKNSKYMKKSKGASLGDIAFIKKKKE